MAHILIWRWNQVKSSNSKTSLILGKKEIDNPTNQMHLPNITPDLATLGLDPHWLLLTHSYFSDPQAHQIDTFKIMASSYMHKIWPVMLHLPSAVQIPKSQRPTRMAPNW